MLPRVFRLFHYFPGITCLDIVLQCCQTEFNKNQKPTNVAFSGSLGPNLEAKHWVKYKKNSVGGQISLRTTTMKSTKTSKSNLWPCGSLQTAAITASVAEMVAIILVTVSYLEKTLSSQMFSIPLVALSLVSFFLIFSNLLMLYGSVKQMHGLLLPWMILHVAAILGTLVFCSVKFHSLSLVGYRSLLILGILIQVYFFALVFLYYQELKVSTDIRAAQDDLNVDTEAEGKTPNECLIDLELEEKADETFSQLALRNQESG